MDDQGEIYSVPIEVAVQFKLSEFDKSIADAEAVVADLKKQKFTFLHEQNLNSIKAKYPKPV